MEGLLHGQNLLAVVVLIRWVVKVGWRRGRRQGYDQFFVVVVVVVTASVAFVKVVQVVESGVQEFVVVIVIVLVVLKIAVCCG